jgi:hypothetical protein
MLRSPEDPLHIRQHIQNSVRRLIKDQNPTTPTPAQSLQRRPALALLCRKKSVEGKRLACTSSASQPAGYQCTDGRIRAGNGKYRHTCRNRRRRNLATRVGDAWRASIADHGNARAGLQLGGKLPRTTCFIVHVVAHRRRADVKVIEQLLRLPRVLAGNLVYRPQHPQGAQRHVLQVADGRGDEVKPRGQRLPLAFASLVLVFRVHPCRSVVSFVFPAPL